MKTSPLSLLLLAAGSLSAPVFGQGTGTAFTNYIKQTQYPSGTVMYMRDLAATGNKESALAIDPVGPRFHLWTVKNTNPPTEYRVGDTFVGTFIPTAAVSIETEDPYQLIPRTRADRWFKVNIFTNTLKLDDPNAPEAAQMMDVLHHVQSYGTTNGTTINRDQATLTGTNTIDQNGTTTYHYPLTTIPGGDRAKVKGEERFTVFSLPDYQLPNGSPLDSRYVQIWPVADARIEGITDGQLIRFKMPPISIILNDLYPGSSTYTQVYKGAPTLGKTGWYIPGGAWPNTKPFSVNETLNPVDYDNVFDEGGDGLWTMEVVTSTPFGLDRLAYVTFHLDRTIEFNGSITSQE